VFVEPNGDTVQLRAGGKLRVIAEADRPGEFEVEYSGEYVSVSAWATARTRCELDGRPVERHDALPGPTLPQPAPGQRPPTYVSLILVGDNEVTVEAGPDVDPRELRALGGRRGMFNRGTWTFPAREEQAFATLLEGLRDLGVAFAWEPGGWPPAAIFTHLRDRGLVHGRIKAVTWRAPDDVQVFEL
jgi:hypothetical protein